MWILAAMESISSRKGLLWRKWKKHLRIKCGSWFRCVSKMKTRPLSVISFVYHEHQLFLATRWASNESYQNYKFCFGAQLSKLDLLRGFVALSNIRAALFLLVNACKVDSAQWISVFAAAAPSQLSLPTCFCLDISGKQCSMTLSHWSFVRVIRQTALPVILTMYLRTGLSLLLLLMLQHLKVAF